MRVFFIITYCLMFMSFVADKKPCPTNLDEIKINILEKNINFYNGKVVAFDAVVSDIKVGNVNKPFYKAVLGKEHLWVGAHGQMGDVKKGNSYRILGLVCIWIDDAVNAKYNDKKYFILSLAHINLQTKMASVFPDAKSAFDEWTEGKIPSVSKE